MPTITGAHSIIYSRNPEADRAFFKDVLGFPHVDVGGGWLIFALPPAEAAFHPAETNDLHEFYLITDDVHGLVDSLRKHGFNCTPPEDQRWGVLTQVSLPGGGRLGVYQPRHERPEWRGDHSVPTHG
jgi:catechol 2,3-dioxygenase-like lactoylglutathione lyase family enzyme